jgi:GNAT superfamily N-acetyltransferase
MRASEFIIEYRKNAMVGGIDLSFEYDDKFGESARVQAFSNGRKLGYAEFLIVRDNELEATDLEVDERYRGQGIARLMYDFVKQQGYKIHRSHAQTIDGHAFWNKNRGEDDRVWENFADGKVKGKSRPGRVKRAGASCNGSVTDLRRKAKNASGEKAKMYHWCANMKSGRRK